MAFYYCWIGFFTFWLVLPGLLGLGLWIYQEVTGFTWCDAATIDWLQIGAAALVVAWCTVASEAWKGEEAIIATKWGTEGAVEVDKARPEFHAQTIGGHGADEWYFCGVRNPWAKYEGLYYELTAAMGSRHENTTEDYKRNPVSLISGSGGGVIVDVSRGGRDILTPPTRLREMIRNNACQ